MKACTGSGKTLAYLIPLIERLIEYKKILIEQANKELTEENKSDGVKQAKSSFQNNEIIALVIAPSRELVI